VIGSAARWLMPARPDARSSLRRDVIRVLIVADLLLGLYYFTWRYAYSINWSILPFALALLAAETYSFIDSLLFGLTVWRLKERSAPAASPPHATVDVFITCYNEPVELVRITARGAQAISTPHRTYLLDDGDSPAMKRMATEEGIEYITRSADWRQRPRHAKAGNLSNALMQTDGEFVLVLDADQVPKPSILQRTLGYFGDDGLAFVQTPQLFYNVPRSDPFGSQAPLFYGPIQQGKDGWNAAFFCGSNAILRREALLQLGVIGYVRAMEDRMKGVLLVAGKLFSNLLADERYTSDPRLRNALVRLRQSAADAESARSAGESLQEVTFRFQRRMDRIAQDLVLEDVNQIRADLASVATITADLEESTHVQDVDEVAFQALNNHEWSPLAAVEVVRTMVRAIDLDRADEAQPILPLATISVTEDMATAMRLHALGWRSVYHDEVLAVGMAPEDLQSSLQQRLRWAQGTIQVLLRENPLLVRGLSMGQRLMYLATMWGYLSGFASVVYLLSTMIYLVFGLSPVASWTADFFWHLNPNLAANQVLFIVVGWGRHTWRGQQYHLALFPLWIQAFISAAANVVLHRRLDFVVTPKVPQTGPRFQLVAPQLVVMAFLLLAIVIGLLRLVFGLTADVGPILLNVGWATYDLVLLSAVLDAALYDFARTTQGEPSAQSRLRMRDANDEY
jgi:cellulose synthase (UDP-forming)